MLEYKHEQQWCCLTLSRGCTMINGIQPVRRNKATGAIEPRKQGRPHPDFEYGYLDENKVFHLEPAKNKGKATVQIVRNAPQTGAVSEIEKIVQQEVQRRLTVAKAAAVETFSATLGV